MLNAVDQILDEIDVRLAARQRYRLGLERRLVSWTKMDSGMWRACLSLQGLPRLRFVRRGKTRTKAVENSAKALDELIKLLASRGLSLPPSKPE